MFGINENTNKSDRSGNLRKTRIDVPFSGDWFTASWAQIMHESTMKK